jgi:hypothetical protein
MEISVAKAALDNEHEYEDDDEYESESTPLNFVLVILLVADNRILNWKLRI